MMLLLCWLLMCVAASFIFCVEQYVLFLLPGC